MAHREKVIDFLIERKVLQEGEGLYEVPEAYQARVMSNVDAFKQAAGLEVAS